MRGQVVRVFLEVLRAGWGRIGRPDVRRYAMTTSVTDPRAVTIPSTVPAWAHAAGMLSLGQAQVPKDATGLADRALFTECIAIYCWSYDERRLDALPKCFTDDAVWAGNI